MQCGICLAVIVVLGESRTNRRNVFQQLFLHGTVDRCCCRLICVDDEQFQ
jgi:hypothetical protein